MEVKHKLIKNGVMMSTKVNPNKNTLPQTITDELIVASGVFARRYLKACNLNNQLTHCDGTNTGS